jgi:hypothetical protein
MRMRVEDEKYRPKPPFWKNMSGDVALGNVLFAMEAVMAGLDTSGSQRVLECDNRQPPAPDLHRRRGLSSA